MRSGSLLLRCWRLLVDRMTAVVRGRIRAPCCTACSGCWARARIGLSFRRSILSIRPVIDAFRSGYAMGAWSKRCAYLPATCAREASSTWKKRSSMPPSRARKKRGFAVGPTRRGKGTKIVAIATGDGLPLAITVDSASPAECQLVEFVLAGCFSDQLPQRLIGDKAYDSDPLDRALEQNYAIELIATIDEDAYAIRRPEEVSAIQKTMEGRTTLRLAAQLQKTRHPMGISHRQLPRFRAPWMPQNHAQASMRWLLEVELPNDWCSLLNWR